jgi:phospholipid-binding lipoprotein MlaA
MLIDQCFARRLLCVCGVRCFNSRQNEPGTSIMLNLPVLAARTADAAGRCVRPLAVMSALLLAVAPVAAADKKDTDPWEGFNRKVFAFNDGLDRYIARPLAVGYQYVTPQDVDDSVTNFFSNLGDVLVVVNDLGQLKFGQAASDTTRFLVNSTIGFFGVFDVASHIGLSKHNEDFGQTLGYWGVGTGPYLVLPILGPSNVRDTFGEGLNWVSGVSYSNIGQNTSEQVELFVLKNVDVRADLISSESLITGDKYVFLRSLYMQRREYLVNDGVTADSFGDFDNFDDDEEWDDDWDQEPAPAAAE